MALQQILMSGSGNSQCKPGHEFEIHSYGISPNFNTQHLHFVVNIHLNDEAVENDSDGRLINNMIRTRCWCCLGGLARSRILAGQCPLLSQERGVS